MIYTQILPTYKYDVLAQSLAARELEHFHYEFDRINFERMLETLSTGSYRSEIQQRLQDTLAQIVNIELIYQALLSQVDNQQELTAAIQRQLAKQQLPALTN